MPSVDREKIIGEMQFLEQNLQNLLYQKQAFQIELSETDSALKEIENSSDEVFKVIGGIMIRAEKSKIEAELLDKKKAMELRIKAIDRQENLLSEKLQKVREEILKSAKN